MCRIMAMNELPPSYNELIELLKKGGELSFEFERKYKKRFRLNIDRLVRLEKINRKNLISRAWYLLYGTYVGLLIVWGTRNSKGLENAITVFQVARRYINPIEGRDLENGNVQAVFKGRT